MTHWIDVAHWYLGVSAMTSGNRYVLDWECPNTITCALDSRGDGTSAHVRNFLDCVKSRKTPTANVRVAVEAARAAHLGNLALKQKRQVRWNAQQERIES